MCVEHVLYAILNHETGVETIEKCGGNPEQIKEELEKFFEEKLTKIDSKEEYVLQQTIGFQRMIQRAINQARSAEKARSTWGTSWPPSSRKKIPMRHFTWSRKASPGLMCSNTSPMRPTSRKRMRRPWMTPPRICSDRRT